MLWSGKHDKPVPKLIVCSTKSGGNRKLALLTIRRGSAWLPQGGDQRAGWTGPQAGVLSC